MMTQKTVRQLIQVFDYCKKNYLGGSPLQQSYQDAVRRVADECSVTYQTIGDGCRRRLNLSEISQLHRLLKEWMQGDAKGLVSQLKQNSVPSAHLDIESFFSKSIRPPVTVTKATVPSISEQRADTFSFRLSETDSRLLRALAEIEGSSPSQMVAGIVQSTVQKRMKEFAARIVDGGGVPKVANAS